MLNGHPHITRMRISESYRQGRARQTLIVETPLNRASHEADYKALEDYLQLLAGSEFMEFDSYIIRQTNAADSPPLRQRDVA